MGFDDIEAPVTIIRPINPDGSFGEPIRLEKLQVINWWEELEPVTDFQDGLTYKNSIKFLSDTISGTLKCNLPRKMSRKKFKKWLMSKGINRDSSEWFCRVVKSFKGKQSYQLLYFNGLFTSTSQDLVNALFDTIFPINK